MKNIILSVFVFALTIIVVRFLGDFFYEAHYVVFVVAFISFLNSIFILFISNKYAIVKGVINKIYDDPVNESLDNIEITYIDENGKIFYIYDKVEKNNQYKINDSINIYAYKYGRKKIKITPYQFYPYLIRAIGLGVFSLIMLYKIINYL